MTTCAKCGRTLARPQYVGGKPYGSTCVREVAPMVRAAASVIAGRLRVGAAVRIRRRRAKAQAAVLQMVLFEQEAA